VPAAGSWGDPRDPKFDHAAAGKGKQTVSFSTSSFIDLRGPGFSATHSRYHVAWSA
jgi:hypothetical protein